VTVNRLHPGCFRAARLLTAHRLVTVALDIKRRYHRLVTARLAKMTVD
jgi:hypothetical protein